MKTLSEQNENPEFDEGCDCMKKLIALVLALVCVLGLVGCDKQAPAPKMTNEIYTGEIKEISNTIITIISDGEEISFSITNLAAIDMPSDLVAGDKVMVETAYVVGTAEPFPAIRIVNAKDSSIE